MKRLAVILALLAASCAHVPPPEARQADLDSLAGAMGYRFTVIDNNPDSCPGEGGNCFISEIAITTPEAMPAALSSGLEIRFGFVSRIISAESDVFGTRLVNGDLNALVLKPGATLRPGTTYKVRLTGAGHFYSTSYPMPNVHLLASGLEARTIAATRPRIDPDTKQEVLPFVTPMTDEANLATASPADRTQWLTPERAFARYAERSAAGAAPETVVLPRPLRVTRPGGAPLDLRGGVRLSLEGVAQGQIAAALAHLADAGAPASEAGSALTIAVGAGHGLAPEGYRLTAGASGIRIAAADAAGASHAIRSLAQQLAHEQGRLAPIEMEDAPRFGFRGLHVDVARNFHSREQLLVLIEQMARYKLNKLHLHLADDEGWRLEVRALPELAQVGGFRCYDEAETRCLQPQLGADPDPAAPTNGYLSQSDYVALVRAARERHIEVIPSLDMPGHSRAAIRAMEARHARLMAAGDPEGANRYRLVEPADRTEYRSIQNYNDNTLNVCIESTYRFLDTVLGELTELHRQAGAPLRTYHIGADETAGAWSDSPACRAVMAETGLEAPQLGARFIERVSNSLAARGVKPAGWSDGMGHTDPQRMPGRVQSNIWGGLFTGGVPEAHGQLNRGWDIVLSIPDFGYLDMPYVPHPEEPGYDWAAREVDTYKVFRFMPENLPANAALATNILSQPSALDDATPLQPGRRIAGIQGQLWSETVRTDARVEYMLFPRLLALAERAWRRTGWEPQYQAGERWTFGDPRIDQAAVHADWRDFAARLAAQFPQLDRAGIDYRLAPPGARVANGRLEANAEFPSLEIQYRVGQSDWRPYAGPVAVNGPVMLRTRSPDGSRFSRTITVP